MVWVLCDIIGTGTEADPFRPAAADHTSDWSTAVTLESWGKTLVRCDPVASMDVDPRIERMRRSMLNGGGVPDTPGDWQNPGIAQALVQRGIALQKNPDLEGAALKQAAESVRVRVLPSAGPGKRGTFTDNFDDAGVETNLEDWTPSGGTSWTRLDGSAGDAVVTTGGALSTDGNAVFSIAPDQGNANQYVEWVETGTGGSSGFFICRLIDASNFIGARAYQTGSREVWRRTSGSYTQLGSSSFAFAEDDVLRLEVSGDDYELFINDASIISGSESQGNTETTQGFGGSSAQTGLAAKSYEAGTLGGAATETVVTSLSAILQKQQLLTTSVNATLKQEGFTRTAQLNAYLEALSADSAPQGVNFDGTNDWLNRGADLTGNADSKLFTGSLWFKTAAVSGNIYRADGFTNHISVDSIGSLNVSFFSSGFVGAFGLEVVDVDDGEWHHLCFSTNGVDGYAFFDDESVSLNSLQDVVIDFTKADHAIGATTSGGTKFNGDLAQFLFAPGVFVDISIEENRRKFVGPDATSSRNFGADGSTPIGSVPLIFLEGDVADWHVNDGTGGGFTENGALTDASENPPDYPLPTVTASIDMIVQRQGALLTASLSAVLMQQQQQIAEVSAVLRQVQALSVDVDAALAERATLTTSVDSVVMQQQTLAPDIDAVLLAAQSAVAQMDAALHAQISKTTSMDARLVNLRTAAASINAILLRQIQKTASINAALRGSLAVSASMDALLRTGFWQADDEGDGNWRKTPEGNGFWVKAPNTSTGWGNA